MFNILKTKNKKQPKDLSGVLAQIQKLEEKVEKLSDELSKVKKTSEISIQKVGLVRYNPFSGGMGGDQSFSIALLDSNGDGFVITSLFSREGTRIYTKPLKSGKSEYQLSEEEEGAIKRAKGI